MKRNIIILWFIWWLFCSLSCLADTYSTEYQDAYRYAYSNWITTAKTIDKADMKWPLTRIAMAKMMSQYAMNVLLLEPDTNRECYFNDVSNSLNAQYGYWATLACQLWLMWVWSNGNIPKNFKPYDIVTRWQWATVLSRALSKANGDIVNEGNPFYKPHMNYLQSKWIIKSLINPPHSANEKRWNAMLMLMRSANIIESNENNTENEDKQRIEDTIKDYNWVIINWADLRPNTAIDNENTHVRKGHWGYTIITRDLTSGTMYIDYDYNFILKINGDGLNIKTLELDYNDYSKLTSVTIKWENWNHTYYTNIYSWKDYLSECKATNNYGFSNLETNFKIRWGNEKYIFIIRSVDIRDVSMRMKLFTNTDSLKELVERKHCDCKSCRVESYDF